MSVAAIETVEELDASWLNAVLAQAGIDGAVRNTSPERVGTGQMGSCFRVRLDYERGTGPSSVIVKLPATNPGSRAAGQMGYRAETHFYRELAQRVQVTVPRCYFAEMNASGDGFTLVLEDLDRARQGDQIAGCSIEQATNAALNVAGLHASTWNDTSLRALDWLIPDLAANTDYACALLAAATGQFVEKHAVAPETANVLHAFNEGFVNWATRQPPNFALLHSDYRLDNLMFEPPGSTRPVIAVDWQVATLGAPLRDIGFLLGTSLSPDDRRSAERAIIEAYHRRLLELGVEDYSFDECWNDYRQGLFQCLLITVLGSFVAQPTERGDRMFMTMAERATTAIRDLDALSLLR